MNANVTARRNEIELWRITTDILRSKMIGIDDAKIKHYSSIITNECFVKALGKSAQTIIRERFNPDLPTNGVRVTSRRRASKRDATYRSILTVAKNYLNTKELYALAKARVSYNNLLRSLEIDELDHDWFLMNTRMSDETISGKLLKDIMKVIK
jgi:hypothetical protein